VYAFVVAAILSALCFFTVVGYWEDEPPVLLAWLVSIVAWPWRIWTAIGLSEGANFVMRFAGVNFAGWFTVSAIAFRMILRHETES
jgi:hypothetical protein